MVWHGRFLLGPSMRLRRPRPAVDVKRYLTLPPGDRGLILHRFRLDFSSCERACIQLFVVVQLRGGRVPPAVLIGGRTVPPRHGPDVPAIFRSARTILSTWAVKLSGPG